MGIEFALAEIFANSDIGGRVVLMDDSYSMEELDGSTIQNKKNMKCTRHEEMMNIIREACDIYGNQARLISTGCDIDAFNIFEYKDLCDTLKDISFVKNTILSIFTDSMPPYNKITKILGNFSGKIIVRLCGNIPELYLHWNLIKFKLKGKLTIIQNFAIERKIVKEINPELNYTYSLHRIREYGVNDDLLLSISSERLTADSIDFINELVKNPYHIRCC